MNSYVAIVAPDFDPATVIRLKTALQADGARCTVCPESERREALRWVMGLSPAQYSMCIICDTDGRNLGSIYTALDPKIPAVGWCPGNSDLSRAVATVTGSPLLISFAESAELAAQSVRPILFSNQVAAPPNLDKRPLAAAPGPVQVSLEPLSQTSASFDEDAAVYEQLETLMASPVKKDLPKQEPVQIQKPGLDFSSPLRHLMSKGRNLAHKESHPEVLGAHYLAALDEPFTGELEHAGLTRQIILDYLSGFASGEDITNEPVISDEAFEGVSRAKSRVRESGKNCIRTTDFLAALLSQNEGSVADIIQDNGLSMDLLNAAITSLDEIEEPCSSAFFAPSSLDQENFYQFDPAQVRTVEERLRTLPGFQKAAARVAESRTAHPSSGAGPDTSEPPRPAPPVVAEPPEKPEILKISADFPSVDAVEHIADRLLEGHLVAFPADVMFALAADASNPYAIDRLRDAAGIPEDKPISILINSTSQLKHLVRADLEALEPLFEEFWPGPLTLVFKATGSIARHVSSGGNIAVRQPADNTSLAILSMLGRPLAVTSWNEIIPGQPIDVEKLAGHLSGLASVIISHGEPVPQLRTTVVDLSASPWRVIREGAIPGQAVLHHMR